VVRLSPYVNSIVHERNARHGQAAWYIMAFGLALCRFGSPRLGRESLRHPESVRGVGRMLFIVAVVFYFLFRRQRVLDAAEV
jgi:hypothetical protein